MDDPLVDGDLHLRQVDREDLTMLKHWRNEWSVRSTTREYRLLNGLDQERWFESLSQKPPENVMFVIVAADKPIGCAGLVHCDWKNRVAEVSIYIGSEDHRGRGIGKRVVKMLEDYAFGELALHKVYAEIFGWNRESVNLFDAAGFQQEATIPSRVFRDGRYHVSYFYGSYADDWRIRRQRKGGSA